MQDVSRNLSALNKSLQEGNGLFDILLGLLAALALNGEEAVIADLAQGVKVGREVDLTLAERLLLKETFAAQIIGNGRDAVDVVGIDRTEHDTILGVRMNDVILEVMDGHDGIVACDHDEVGGVKVDRHAAAAEAVKEVLQHERGFGARFDSKACAYAVGVLGQLTAGRLHHTVTGVCGIVGHATDVRRDDVRAQLLCQIHDTLGLFDQGGVGVGVGKAVAEIAADSGKDQAVFAHRANNIRAAGGRHIFGRILAFGAIHLQAVHAKGGSVTDRLKGIEAEGFDHSADFKIAHVLSFLAVFQLFIIFLLKDGRAVVYNTKHRHSLPKWGILHLYFTRSRTELQ